MAIVLIGLTNLDGRVIDLQGWFLTDDASALRKWEIPESLVLQPGVRQVIFASGKNQVTPNTEFHTIFRLDRDGEYLAFVRPYGEIAFQLPSQYPS